MRLRQAINFWDYQLWLASKGRELQLAKAPLLAEAAELDKALAALREGRGRLEALLAATRAGMEAATGTIRQLGGIRCQEGELVRTRCTRLCGGPRQTIATLHRMELDDVRRGLADKRESVKKAASQNGELEKMLVAEKEALAKAQKEGKE